MSPRPGTPAASNASFPHAVAFIVHATRNIVVQVAGLAMVVLTALNVTPWPYVAGWAVVAIAVLATEDRLLRIAARRGESSPLAGVWAPILRIAATLLYA